jgi:Zn-dependent protease
MAYEPPVRPESPIAGPPGPPPVPVPAPDYYPPSYTPEPSQPSPWWKRAGGVLIALAILAVKFGAKLKGLLLLIPKLKIFTTSASMLVSVAAYSLIFGWSFALGFVLLILVHEMGHVIQLRREGVPASAPLFIPFLGAVVGMKRLPDDAGAEARVGLAGPALGSLGCLIPLALWGITDNEFWQALAFTGFFINLFNLLPVLPLDGGRAMAALSPWMWIAGFVMFVAVAIAFPNPIILIIVLLGGLETWRRWKARKTPESQRYYRVSRGTRVGVALTFIGLALALAVGMDATHLERDFDDV